MVIKGLCFPAFSPETFWDETQDWNSTTRAACASGSCFVVQLSQDQKQWGQTGNCHVRKKWASATKSLYCVPVCLQRKSESHSEVTLPLCTQPEDTETCRKSLVGFTDPRAAIKTLCFVLQLLRCHLPLDSRSPRWICSTMLNRKSDSPVVPSIDRCAELPSRNQVTSHFKCHSKSIWPDFNGHVPALWPRSSFGRVVCGRWEDWDKQSVSLGINITLIWSATVKWWTSPDYLSPWSLQKDCGHCEKAQFVGSNQRQNAGEIYNWETEALFSCRQIDQKTNI